MNRKENYAVKRMFIRTCTISVAIRVYAETWYGCSGIIRKKQKQLCLGGGGGGGGGGSCGILVLSVKVMMVIMMMLLLVFVQFNSIQFHSTRCNSLHIFKVSYNI